MEIIAQLIDIGGSRSMGYEAKSVPDAVAQALARHLGQWEEEDNVIKHTPGPWKINKLPWATYIGAGPEDEITGHSRDCVAYNVGQLANAQLIAAAPELLAACEVATFLLMEIRGFASDVFGGDSSLTDCLDSVLTEIDAAIAKATGADEPN